MKPVTTARIAVVLLLSASAVFAEDEGVATADTLVASAAAADTTARTGMSLSEILNLSTDVEALALAEDLEADEPFITSWTRAPKAAFSAKMQKVGYSSEFANGMTFRDKSSLTKKLALKLDDYRSQEKIVENRSGNVNYSTDNQRSLVGSFNLSDNWTRDEVTNSSGNTNVNQRETRMAMASLKRNDLSLAGIDNDIIVKGSYNQQLAEQLKQRNDISEASLDGALRSGFQAREWLSLHSGLYAMSKSGERSLALETNPSSTDGDSIRAGVFYERGVITGGMTISKSSFNKRYLDYRRNANGIVDTIGAIEKIVQELERDDAITMSWDNRIQLGGLSLSARLARDLSENSYRASGVGMRERHQDTVNLNMGFRPTRLDTVTVTYGYQYKWDDQTYAGATLSRGRQVSSKRDLGMSLTHALFAHTDLKFNFRTSLSQDIAEGEFNVNDRDRLETGFNMKMDTFFANGVNVSLSFDARRTEDISIRSERSSNNSIKDTYEISPSYSVPVAEWLDLYQSFRVWIQYTDYVFSHLETVNKLDDYNKRGNLNTKVSIKPNSRLTLTIRHDLNIKNNAKKSRTDVAGGSFYSPESDQTVSKIDFAMSYQASNWLSLEGTTFRKKDLKETFGDRASETERYSGEVAVGGKLKKDFGTGKSMSLGARRFFAHGPNVQELNKKYWDADIEVAWRF